MEDTTRRRPRIMELIANAPWREAVTYRDSWPHEYVVVRKDGQKELLAAFCERIGRGEGVECRFFHQTRRYLFLDDHKYWIMVECDAIDLDAGDHVLNRARLYRDRRDFVIQGGDTGRRGDYPGEPARSLLGTGRPNDRIMTKPTYRRVLSLVPSDLKSVTRNTTLYGEDTQHRPPGFATAVRGQRPARAEDYH